MKNKNTQQKENIYKNVLIQYKGGGYDGCFWEWNFCYFDNDSIFYDIFSSGRNGCNTTKKILNYLLEEEKDSDYYIYNMSIQEDWDDFARSSNVGHVQGIASWFCDNNFSIDVSFIGKCSECGEEMNVVEGYLDGLEGCGGIAAQYTELICEDCRCLYTCTECGEYFGKDMKFDEDNYCEYCTEEKIGPERLEIMIKKEERGRDRKERGIDAFNKTIKEYEELILDPENNVHKWFSGSCRFCKLFSCEECPLNYCLEETRFALKEQLSFYANNNKEKQDLNKLIHTAKERLYWLKNKAREYGVDIL
jgi:hypothetical protein